MHIKTGHSTDLDKGAVCLFDRNEEGHGTNSEKEAKYGYGKRQSTESNREVVRLSTVIEESLAIDSTVSDYSL